MIEQRGYADGWQTRVGDQWARERGGIGEVMSSAGVVIVVIVVVVAVVVLAGLSSFLVPRSSFLAARLSLVDLRVEPSAGC